MTAEEHRRLDAEVAEKVMGWHRKPGDELWQTANGSVTEWGTPDAWWGVTTNCMWRPSTDIAAAWQVIAAMNDRHWLFLVCQPHDGNHAAVRSFEAGAAPFGPTAIFENLSYFIGPKVTVQAPTAPEAICRAALSAMASVQTLPETLPEG